MIARFVPGPLVRFFARPYVAGARIEDGLDTAAELVRDRGVVSTLALLGEHVHHASEVATFVRIHEDVIEGLGRDSRFGAADRPTLSIKPSAFTAGDVEDARAPLEHLAGLARERGVALTIDMEDRAWTDMTIDLATSLFSRGFDVGTVLQTRLNRTEADLDRFPPGMRVRLVIGIYPEPPEVAITDKREMKERLLVYGARLLARGLSVELGTHDEEFVSRFMNEVAPAAPERCEVQMLLGVPRRGLQDRLQRGDLGPPVKVRLYVPFAVSWRDATAYLRRRMKESPSMMWLVLRNVKERQR